MAASHFPGGNGTVASSSPLTGTGGIGDPITAAAQTGTGAIVLATSPTLITPTLGVATATTLSFAATHGLSFAGGVANPITVKGNDNAGDTQITFDNASDGQVQLGFPQFTQFEMGNDLNIDAAGHIKLNGVVAFGSDASFPAGERFYFAHAYDNAAVTAGETTLATTFVSYTATSPAASDVYDAVSTGLTYGTDGVAAIGTIEAANTAVTVQGSGSASNEFATQKVIQNVQLGTGFTQSTGPIGRSWLFDTTLLGPIGVQPNLLDGLVMVANNYYNGSPADQPSVGIALLSGKADAGGGQDATHSAATTYPMDIGLWIGGTASASAAGFTTAIKLGGAASPWGESGSVIGTAIDITQYATRGIYIHAPIGSPTASIEADGLIKGGTIQASSAYKSVDGTSGVTAGPFTTISTITVKNGIVTALTGS